ncbi:hypothetical protein [Streptomyces sp. NPDC127072]|uniref:hypothetical protein n=1 Tax=Streptomyces sp. NPDC127072 TaxID=3347129 RepID=UPI003659AE8B
MNRQKLTLMPNSGMFCVVRTPTVAAYGYVFPVVARDEHGLLWIEKEFTNSEGEKTTTMEPILFRPHDGFTGSVQILTREAVEGMFPESDWDRVETGYAESYINYTAIFISDAED